MTEAEHRALQWIINGQTGMSSKSLWAKMMGVEQRDVSYPHDPADLKRCLLLLEQVPEWRDRLPEMGEISPVWAALVARWDEIASAFIRESGGLANNYWSAPYTYLLMKEAIYGDQISEKSINEPMGERA